MAAPRITGLVALLAALSWACSSTPGVTEYGTETVGRYVVRYLGPELEAAVGYRQAALQLGDEWLILAAEFTSAPSGGVITVNRSDVAAITPDGRHLALVDQTEFRQVYGSMRVRVDRALAALPVLGRYDTSRMPCDRWFLVGPFDGFAYDRVSVNTFQVCSGPLVFHVAGGVQPGRWRLVIELTESTADIPFEIEEPD
jgi:hypothetical protein